MTDKSLFYKFTHVADDCNVGELSFSRIINYSLFKAILYVKFYCKGIYVTICIVILTLHNVVLYIKGETFLHSLPHIVLDINIYGLLVVAAGGVIEPE